MPACYWQDLANQEFIEETRSVKWLDSVCRITDSTNNVLVTIKKVINDWNTSYYLYIIWSFSNYIYWKTIKNMYLLKDHEKYIWQMKRFLEYHVTSTKSLICFTKINTVLTNQSIFNKYKILKNMLTIAKIVTPKWILCFPELTYFQTSHLRILLIITVLDFWKSS